MKKTIRETDVTNISITKPGEEKEDIKCTRCKFFRYPKVFLNDKGKTLKTCKSCRDFSNNKYVFYLEPVHIIVI